MNRRLHILLMALATALLAAVAAACVQPLEQDPIDPNARDFIIRLYVPDGRPDSKAATGEVASMGNESKLYNLQLWMFDHADPDATGDALAAIDAATAVVYSEVTDIRSGAGWANTENRASGYYTEWIDANTLEIHCALPGYLMDRPDEDMLFDFYILANHTAIGSPASRTMTRGELKSLTFGHVGSSDPFGVTNPCTGVASGTGLPVSGLYLGENGTGVDLSFLKTASSLTIEQIHQKLPVVQLQRAVSRIRFVFARPTGLNNVQIQRIEINGNQIPVETFVFPRGNGQPALPGNAYESAVTLLANADDTPLIPAAGILEVPDPLLLRSGCDTAVTFTLNGTSLTKKPKDMSAQQYDSYLTWAIGDKTTTEKLVYLRESDKKIKGRIVYSLNGGTTFQEATFEMDDQDATSFHRNHSWTVYGYFRGGHLLQIWPFVNPWEYHQEITSFSSQIECTNVRVDGAIEAHGTNHDLSNEGELDKDGNVITTSSVDYYARYYQVRRLDMSQTDPHFEVTFTPSAPFGGYWMLVPEFIGEGSQNMFDIEVERVAGGETDELIGQIMKMEVKIIIRPSANYNYANDEHSYAMILKSYFSPSHNFSPSYSADSEFQDVHRDGRYSYWRFTLTHGDH